MSDNKKPPQDDIIATSDDQPDILPDDALEDAQGGFGVKLTRQSLSSSKLGPISDSIYAGSVGDSLYAGNVADTIYAGSPGDVLGGLRNISKIYGG